jgi:hypothetical protein
MKSSPKTCFNVVKAMDSGHDRDEANLENATGTG